MRRKRMGVININYGHVAITEMRTAAAIYVFFLLCVYTYTYALSLFSFSLESFASFVGDKLDNVVFG